MAKLEFFLPPGCGCDLVEVPPETASQPNRYIVIKMCQHHASADSMKLQNDELKRRLIAIVDKSPRATYVSRKELEAADPAKFTLVEEPTEGSCIYIKVQQTEKRKDQPQFVCNKCGYAGPVQYPHYRFRDPETTEFCTYYAVPV